MSATARIRLQGVVVIVTLTVMVLSFMAIRPAPAMAYTTMRVTSGNLTTLSGFPTTAYGTSGKLKYTYGVKLAAYSRTEYNVGGYYRIGNPSTGTAWCVDAVKSLSNNFRSTTYWVKGGQVTAGGVSPGVIIATFNSSGKYSGHVAVFKRYIRNSAGTITGIEVWDQNWSSPYDYMFRKHVLYKTGTGLADADSYYWVKY